MDTFNKPPSVKRLLAGALSTNCWLYTFSGSTAVIDPGGDAADIIRVIKQEELIPKFIILTHGHFDHIAALPDLHEAFPDAEIAIHAADMEYIGGNGYELARADFIQAINDDSFIRSEWREMPKASIQLNDGDAAGALTVLHTPGHTKGSISLYDAENGILFSGDTLFRGGIGRTDLYGGSITALEKSLIRLFTLSGETRVFPGHGSATTIKHENAHYK